MRIAALLMVLAATAAGCGSAPDDPRTVGAERSDAAAARLVERLQRGGHVIVLRHAATDSAVDMTDDLADCSRQRNLDAEGRAQSRDIGAAFERLRIPVGRVLASPFCRTRETARAAFGRVRPTRALLSEEFFDDPREARRKGLRSLVSERPRRGANTILVSHGSAIDGAVGVNPEEGDAVVVAPRSGGRGFEVVTTVTPGGWRELERR